MREIHHIVPTCMGGLDIKENRISLSPRAHAIISLLQTEFYNRPCFHRRQLKHLPPGLEELTTKCLSIIGTHAVKCRKDTSRSLECREKQSYSQRLDWSVNLARAETVSACMTKTNQKKSPCPQCGMLMNIGNLTKHLKGTKCKG